MTTPAYDSVAYLAADKFAVFNAAGDSFTSEFAPGLRLRADCGADGVLLGTVAAASFEAATGRTVVTTAMDGGAALTANLAAVLHGNDLPASLCAHAALHAIGGRDALPGATNGVSGLVSLASTAETQAGTNTGKAVTPAGLAASAKGLIAANTTLYVATTGSDTTGTGASSAPYASISRALSSIAGKLIASGTTVTIQVADGAYAVSSSIVIDHPDADKIQILGNTSAETTVAISSINTTAKTVTVVGNYVSNADATRNIQSGDIIGLNGSSTSGLNGAYVVSGVSYDGTNTVITCSAETFASSAVGGGAVVIKPCNRCVLTLSNNIHGFFITTSVSIINGFRMNSPTTNTVFGCIYAYNCRLSKYGPKNIIAGGGVGVYANMRSVLYLGGAMIKGSAIAVLSFGSYVELSDWEGVSVIDTPTSSIGIYAMRSSYISTAPANMITRNTAIPYSPAINTDGNGRSWINQ